MNCNMNGSYYIASGLGIMENQKEKKTEHSINSLFCIGFRVQVLRLWESLTSPDLEVALPQLAKCSYVGILLELRLNLRHQASKFRSKDYGLQP